MTLLEVLLALFLLCVVVLSSFELQNTSSLASVKARVVQQASQVVSSHLEELRAAPFEDVPGLCSTGLAVATGAASKTLSVHCSLVPCSESAGKLICPGQDVAAYQVTYRALHQERIVLEVVSVVAR
ncbi:hypothetical protein GCM10008938_01420 [Deinococcus roseus]|uniref:Prepilin-type cleavage/methylation domain-containing protein n=2 Tax=Deinococcus roseus TaxID=392414 RepID=A0ABQ2CTA6_9DEIO|nr:hypothetical protein GCM10008938_01420 [Deinococcus roseus]